jgi:hypothetical protein
MVTKGIIKSIDLLGNTCTVHIPFFETAGNDPIIETATVSNTPGSYNGYKVGDAVYVAFEDGNMSTPVVIGKLYLGTEKEKADPRGVSNVEESTASKKATLPADASLAADIDKTVPNTTVPYSSLSSIANGLNKLNTDVAQNDRDYGNRFKQVSTAIDEQGTKFSTEINQTNEKIDLTAKELKEDLEGQLEETKAEFQIKSDEISAEVLHKVDSKTNGLGWDLSTNDWIIYAKDSVDVDVNGDGKVDEEDVKEFPLFKVSCSGVEVSGDLKLSGYSKDTIITYTQTNSNTIKPEGDGYTWVPDAPAWEDGKYIWQKTSVIKWEYDKTLPVPDWVYSVASEKIVCLSGASAVAYWLNCSTKTHLGQQQDKVDVIAMLKVGTDLEREDTNATLFYKYVGDPETAWTEIKTEIPDDENGSKIITHKFTLSTLQDKSLEIKAIRNGKEYARETIVFSPVNTPVLVFSKDVGKLEYDSYGAKKINEDELATVSATVYLNNKEVPFITWKWTPRNCTVQDEASRYTNSISVTEIADTVDSGEVDCVATYQDQLGKDQPLTKTFTVLKNKQGKAVYKIDISNSPVSVPATEKGELSTKTKQELPALTLHSLTCYYGDAVLPVDAYWEAGDSAHWNSISDKKFRIKYSAVNVTPEVAVGEVPQNFAIQQLYANTGSILYELYRGTEKVATNKFEVTMQLQGISGISATSYGIDYSALVHRGTNQQEAITATAWKAFGAESKTQNNDVYLRYCWRQAGGIFGNPSSHSAGTIEIKVANFLDADLKIEAGTLVKGVFTPTGESNIITYSPMNTPVLDLSNDSASLTYDSLGTKIGDATVSCTGAVYLDGKVLSTGVSYSWSPANAGETTPLYEGEKLIGSQIVVSNLAADVVEITCTATVSDSSLFKETVTLSKTFTVSKQLQGNSGVSIRSQTTYYALISSKYKKGDIKAPSETTVPILGVRETNDTLLGDTYSRGPWSPTPPEHTPETIKGNPELGDTGPWKYWTSVKTVYSNGTPDFSTPIIDEALSGVYELAQGKTTSYYSELEPTNNPTLTPEDGFVYKPNLKEDDCWFDTINKTLKQCVGFDDSGNAVWEDVGGELVTNKVTATYINALDITAKKVNVPYLFMADGSSTNTSEHRVEIAGFNVQQNTLTTGTESAGNLIKLNSDSTVQYEFEEVAPATLEGDTSMNPPIVVKPFKRAETLWTSTQAENKAHLTYYVSNSNFEGNPNGRGITKITFKKAINNLKFFIKTTSVFTDKDFIVVSTLNARKATSKPVGESNYSHADNYARTPGEVVAVEFPRVEANDYIYITYKASSGQSSPNYGGYIYLPVDTRITVGDHFKVLADGTVYANNLSLGGIVQEETETSLFGNAGQFTAARVEVIDKTDSLNHKTLLKADGREKDEYGNDIDANNRVQLGGFTVTGNTLTAGYKNAGNNITINSELYYKVETIDTNAFLNLLDTSASNTYNNTSYTYKYFNNPIREFRAIPPQDDNSKLTQLEYASTNAGVHASFSVAKITFTQKLTTFDLYLYSGPVSGSTHEDYMWASVLNPVNNSCDFGLNRSNNTLNRGCQGLTRGKAGTVCKVTYSDIEKDDCIYVAYIKGTSTNNEPTSGNDVGYFYMPLNVQSSRLKIGDKFEVMSDGTTYASNLYLTRGDNAQNVQDYVAGELEAMRARFNQLTITSVDGTKTLFKADGTAEDDADRVQIGGFTVSDTTFSAGSGTTAVSLGTNAIMLGGTSTTGDTAAKFSVTNAGYLTAESGKIGGFNLSSTSLTSANSFISLSSDETAKTALSIGGDTFTVNPQGELVAKNLTATLAGHIGGFEIVGNTLTNDYMTLAENAINLKGDNARLTFGKASFTAGNTQSTLETEGPCWFQTKDQAAGIGLMTTSGSNDQTVSLSLTGKTEIYGSTSVTIEGTNLQYATTISVTVTSYENGIWTGFKDKKAESKTKSYTISPATPKISSGDITSGIVDTTGLGTSFAKATFEFYDENGTALVSFTLKSSKTETKSAQITQPRSNNTIQIIGNVQPKTPGSYSIGTSDVRWGGVFVSSGGIDDSSDERLKNIDTPQTFKKYSKFFDNLTPISYTLKNNPEGKKLIGFGAQSVRQALVDSGLTEKDFDGYRHHGDDQYDSLCYTQFIPLNTYEIQQAKKRIAELESEVLTLKTLLEEVKSKIT